MRNNRLRIHSFYSDLLLSIRYLFDNIIFEPGYIKHYEFNVGNRSFQLEYKTQYDMPMAIINYQESHPSLYHPWLLLRTGNNNQSKFPVLFDSNKDLTLELQEEEYEIAVEVTINCESQFSAVELEHKIKSRTPLNKPLHLYSFYTFLEIPDEVLNPLMFDVNNDEIFNLYQKYDHTSDEVVHCCAIRYEPLIRLDNCASSIGTSETRSFSVSCSFVFITGVPVYYDIPASEKPTKNIADYLKEEKVAIPVDKKQPILQLISKLSNDKLVKEYIPIVIDKSHSFNNNFIFDNEYDSSVVGKITKYHYFGYCKIVLEVDSKLEEFKVDFKLVADLKNNKQELTLNGILTGKLTELNITDMTFSGMFYGQFNEKLLNQKVTASEYTIVERSFDVEDPQLQINDNVDFSHTSNFIPLINGEDAHSSMPHVNSRILEFIPEKTKAVGIIIKEYDSTSFHNIDCDEELDEYGNFIIPITYVNLQNNKTYGSVKGKINRSTMILNTEIIKEQYDADFDVIAVLFDFSFKTSPRYGARYIKNVNLNIYPDHIGYDPVAVGVPSASFVQNQFDNIYQYKDLRLLRNYILSPTIDGTSVFEYDKEKDKVLIRFYLDEGFQFYELYQSNKLYWKFTFENRSYDSNGDLITLIDDEVSSNSFILKFECDKELYQDYLKYYSLTEPIFFQIYESIEENDNAHIQE